MKYSQANQGRVFVVRLEDGDIVQDSIESLAVKEGISRAFVQVVGGVDKGSIIITGPEESRSEKIIPIQTKLSDMHEVVGTGTIFPNSSGKIKLHLHMACGRKENTICGDIRDGASVWHVLEVIIVELINNKSKRVLDTVSGFELLMPE